MKKSIRSFFPFVILLFFVFLYGCDSHPVGKPIADFSPTDTDTTEDDIRQQKPKFLDFVPETYHLANTGENNYIRIITNSDDLQKVWMVYYDHNGKQWQTLTWIGKGTHNTIIADTVFNAIYGVVNRTGHIEDPTFYMAYSKDDGKTWQNHPIEKSSLICKKDSAALLFSSDLEIGKDKPAAVLLIQASGGLTSGVQKSMTEWNTDYLCPLMRKIKPGLKTSK